MTGLTPSGSTEAGAVSVTSSSLLSAVVDHPSLPPGVSLEPDLDLLCALAAVPDPRARRGKRHQFVTVLALAVCAVLTGARSYQAIAEWARDLPPAVRRRLGVGRVVPCESTIRRVLQRTDADALDQVLSRWLASKAGPAPALPVIAVDGKTARGARSGTDRAVHLLAALDTTDGTVLGQTVVDGKTNEVNAFAPLLDRVPIAGALITADALHTQRAHVDYLVDHQAHYLLTVKGNQPTLRRQLIALPWRQIPVADKTTDHGHGRTEFRSLKHTTVTAGIGFPGATTALQITRRRRSRKGSWHTQTIYAVTDLDVRQASPAVLADAVRAHWSIENRLHWVRDVTFAEDLSQIRAGNGPAVMASLRNLAISLLRRAGHTNIAAACRHLSRDHHRSIPMLM